MHLHSYRLKNFRRLQDAHVELASDISIFVGANNSGKTSATEAIILFLNGNKSRFSLFDFSSSTWKALNKIDESDPANDLSVIIPSITLDLWFEVSEEDLHLVIPILPSTNWEGSRVGIRVEFASQNSSELLERYRKKKQESLDKAAALVGGAGSYVPWPKSLVDYLEIELNNEFELKYYVLDYSRFDAASVAPDDYKPAPLKGALSGGAVLRSLVRVDCLNAQRHLADTSSGSQTNGGRSEDLSRRLSRFYQRNLEQRAEDHGALKALYESEVGLNKHLMDVFDTTLKRIS